MDNSKEQLYHDMDRLKKFKNQLYNNLDYFSCPMSGGNHQNSSLVINALQREIKLSERRIQNIQVALGPKWYHFTRVQVL